MAYLYIIASSETGPLKLGFSKQPMRRLKQLQTGHSETLKLFYTEEVSDEHVYTMEQILHKENNHHKLRGEWFNMSVADAILEIKHVMIRYSKN